MGSQAFDKGFSKEHHPVIVYRATDLEILFLGWKQCFVQ